MIDDSVIDPSVVDSLFRPLEAESSLNHHSAGRGMHLALAKEAVKAHGGALTLTPKPMGSCVSVTLPLRVPRPLRARFALPSFRPGAQLAGPRGRFTPGI